MTTLSPISQSSTSTALPPHPTRHSTAHSSSSKIRDSCQACAVSKVRCHKQKPACSRCTSRGVVCEYFVTKRPGRKRDTGGHRAYDVTSNSTNAIMPSKPSGRESAQCVGTTFQDSIPPYASPKQTPPLPSVTLGEPSGSESDFSNTAITSNVSDSLGTSSDFDQLGHFEFDSLFTSPSGFGNMEWFESNSLNDYIDTSRLLVPEQQNNGPDLHNSHTEPSSTSLKSFFDSGYSSGGAVQSASQDEEASTSCQCLTQVLDLLRKLSSSDIPRQNTPLDGGMGLSTVTHIRLFSSQPILAENKQFIEIASNILRCSCADDSYLLAMLSMVVFKILDRYTQIANLSKTELGSNSACSIAVPDLYRQGPKGISDGLVCEDRAASRLVLSELHRIQRLVNLLSPKLSTGKTLVGTKNKGRVDGDSANQLVTALSGKVGCSQTPFLATILGQIESDLRRCLSCLSSGIICALHEE